MPLLIVRNDITKMRCDAIVNAANAALCGGGGVDGAIHRAAGPALDEACRALGGCETGKAKLTGGFALPARWIIHTVGPIWTDGEHGEHALLRSCYLESLALAERQGCQSVAFPLISAGAYGFPKYEALQIAVEAIRDYLEEHEMTVYLVVFDRSAFRLSEALQRDIAQYIDDAYAARHDYARVLLPPAAQMQTFDLQQAAPAEKKEKKRRREARPVGAGLAKPAAESEASLQELLSTLDESFSQMVLRKIDEAGIKDSACYKRANIDRKLFSKIRSDVWYRPSKPTALALAVALELPLDQTRELLQKAGFALSHSSKFDLIIEYFIRQGNYDVFQINEALFAFDQPLLGG